MRIVQVRSVLAITSILIVGRAKAATDPSQGHGNASHPGLPLEHAVPPSSGHGPTHVRHQEKEEASADNPKSAEFSEEEDLPHTNEPKTTSKSEKEAPHAAGTQNGWFWFAGFFAVLSFLIFLFT